MAEGCDLVHALAVERLVGEVRVEQQAVLLAGMFGATVTWRTVDERIAEFEEALVAEPERVDGADLELRRALGLRGAGG